MTDATHTALRQYGVLWDHPVGRAAVAPELRRLSSAERYQVAQTVAALRLTLGKIVSINAIAAELDKAAEEEEL